MKHQITHYSSGHVIYECELPDDTLPGLITRHILQKAIAAGVDLEGADLTGAKLPGADLTGAKLTRAKLTRADLTGAKLPGADLTRADLTGVKLTRVKLTWAKLILADLTGADLTGADLTRADLTWAKLTWANIDGAKLTWAKLTGAKLTGAKLAKVLLVGERPIFQIGPIGTRCTYFTAYLTTDGVRLRAGCFFGAVGEFIARLSKEHGDNIHAKEYRAALDLIQCHVDLWTPPTP